MKPLAILGLVLIVLGIGGLIFRSVHWTETKNVALNESDLAKVSGGGTAIVQDVTVNKAKTADKAYAAMDGYIKG